MVSKCLVDMFFPSPLVMMVPGCSFFGLGGSSTAVRLCLGWDQHLWPHCHALFWCPERWRVDECRWWRDLYHKVLTWCWVERDVWYIHALLVPRRVGYMVYLIFGTIYKHCWNALTPQSILLQKPTCHEGHVGPLRSRIGLLFEAVQGWSAAHCLEGPAA